MAHPNPIPNKKCADQILRKMVRFRLRALSVIAIAFLILFQDRLSTPVCNNPVFQFVQEPHDLKVIFVADLLLSGSESTYFNRFFRDHYMSKFFRVPSLITSFLSLLYYILLRPCFNLLSSHIHLFLSAYFLYTNSHMISAY